MRESQSQGCLVAPITLSPVVVRPWDAARDLDWAYRVWTNSFSEKWSLQRAQLKSRLAAATEVYVAEDRGVPIALCAVGYQGVEAAGLLLIMVDPFSVGQGVGKKLLTHVEDALAATGIEQLTLGFGTAGGYFWPGVPVDQRSAWPFFQRNGWQERERSFDLFRNLGDYMTPPWVHERVVAAEITLRISRPADAEGLVRFEKAHFPVWTPFFEATVKEGGYQNILMAETKTGNIVGSLLLQAEEPMLWSNALGWRSGSLSVLGVDPEQQGKGIGIALAAQAMDIIRKRGGTGCYVQWTGLVDWYGKLGTEVWSEYRMSSKMLLQPDIPIEA